MGGSTYSTNNRTVRAKLSGFASNSLNQNFTQNEIRRIHESMDPKKAKLREARDSDVHPNSVPIIVALDVTASMVGIPQRLVIDGLPTLMGNIIQHGTPDPALLFLAVGDHEVDRAPLQVAQFESGDAELDMWLTRTWIEQGGGGNAGESYLLAWYFAAFHTVTDAWEKRKQKGFLFTIGDEPCLTRLPKQAITEIMGEPAQDGYDHTALLKLAQERYEVYHINCLEGQRGKRSEEGWKELLGQNCISVQKESEIANLISTIVSQNVKSTKVDPPVGKPAPGKKEEEIL